MTPRIALLCLFLLCALFPPSLVAGSGEVEWVRHYGTGLEQAKELGRPVIIEFWADWCPPCRQMEREVWPDDKVVELSKKFVLISVDTDRDNGTARRFQVNVLPTIVFADPWGNAINRHEGYLHANSLISMMEAFPEDFSQISEWLAILDKDGKDLQALTRIGQYYRDLGVVDLSNRYLERAVKSKQADSKPELKENLRIWIGLNHLKMAENKKARKSFERCLKEFPDGSQCDKAMLGVVTALLQEGKLDQAQEWYQQLALKFPESNAAQQAARNIEMVRGR
ncbi:MAG TPA: thioredoxin family protein [Acidobacteriota bacterium]|nr:thioredoxin family protein [Acidobacteriota bacterium]